MQESEVTFRQRSIPEIYNVIIGGVCLVALVGMLAWILERQIRSVRMGKVWCVAVAGAAQSGSLGFVDTCHNRNGYEMAGSILLVFVLCCRRRMRC